jgi:hypothetical protein
MQPNAPLAVTQGMCMCKGAQSMFTRLHHTTSKQPSSPTVAQQQLAGAPHLDAHAMRLINQSLQLLGGACSSSGQAGGRR